MSLFVHIILPLNEDVFGAFILDFFHESIFVAKEVHITGLGFVVVGEMIGIETFFKENFFSEGCFSCFVEVLENSSV